MKFDFDILAKYMFILSLCIIMFAYGYICRQKYIFPYRIITEGVEQLENYFPFISQPHYLNRIRYKNSGSTIHAAEKLMPGVTLITSFWPKTFARSGMTILRPGIRLIDKEGNVLHYWDINPKEIWSEWPFSDHINNAESESNVYIHGAYLYPNGDVVFNLEYMGLIRINSKGTVLWKLPYRTHHSVYYDEYGYLWVAGLKWVESGNERRQLFPDLELPFVEETILKISPEGKILKEISVLESIYKANLQYIIEHYRQQNVNDILHLNDVEVLSAELSAQFPLFNRGDIVVSLRDVGSVMVLDQSGKVKWISTGDFIKQHDPDFEQDGWLTVFDNRTGLGRSWIRKINPINGEVITLYPTRPEQGFYTHSGGKHQKLNNGNRLITEVHSGRVFEISAEGELIWEWIQQPYNNKVADVMEGTRYNLTEKDIAKWQKADKKLI